MGDAGRSDGRPEGQQRPGAARSASRSPTSTSQLDQLVIDAANKLGVSLPATPTAQQQGWLNEMQNAAGARFDQIFVDRLRAARTARSSRSSGRCAPSTRDPVIRKLADQDERSSSCTTWRCWRAPAWSSTTGCRPPPCRPPRTCPYGHGAGQRRGRAADLRRCSCGAGFGMAGVAWIATVRIVRGGRTSPTPVRGHGDARRRGPTCQSGRVASRTTLSPGEEDVVGALLALSRAFVGETARTLAASTRM